MRSCTRWYGRACTIRTARSSFSSRRASSSTRITSDRAATGVSHMRLRVTSAAAALIVFLFAGAALAQSPHRDIYLYKAADRDERLLAGARREGQALVYTSLNLKDSVPIKEAFEKKYGVKLELWRASSEKVL